MDIESRVKNGHSRTGTETHHGEQCHDHYENTTSRSMPTATAGDQARAAGGRCRRAQDVISGPETRGYFVPRRKLDAGPAWSPSCGVSTALNSRSHALSTRSDLPRGVECRRSAAHTVCNAWLYAPQARARRAACRSRQAWSANRMIGSKSTPHREQIRAPRNRAWQTGHFIGGGSTLALDEEQELFERPHGIGHRVRIACGD
jgi:hypothetical protein